VEVRGPLHRNRCAEGVVVFEAGSVHVICPNCGAPVDIKVDITSLKVNPGTPGASHGEVRAYFNQYGNSTQHTCRKVT
jgi:hypothetical protein